MQLTIDGGEGGTGAAPLVFTDHVSQPFKIGFSQVRQILDQHEVTQDVVMIGSGKLGFPESTVFAFALGCDMISVAREAMMAIGCIQAQKCQTGHCPTGIATQNQWLMRGLDPTNKAHRLANYIVTLRKETMQLCYAMGIDHPAKITPANLDILQPDFTHLPLDKRFQTHNSALACGEPVDQKLHRIQSLISDS